jgi:hypothetical protein
VFAGISLLLLVDQTPRAAFFVQRAALRAAFFWQTGHHSATKLRRQSGFWTPPIVVGQASPNGCGQTMDK